jgi:hypothetical protein
MQYDALKINVLCVGRLVEANGRCANGYGLWDALRAIGERREARGYIFIQFSAKRIVWHAI